MIIVIVFIITLRGFLLRPELSWRSTSRVFIVVASAGIAGNTTSWSDGHYCQTMKLGPGISDTAVGLAFEHFDRVRRVPLLSRRLFLRVLKKLGCRGGLWLS